MLCVNMESVASTLEPEAPSLRPQFLFKIGTYT